LAGVVNSLLLHLGCMGAAWRPARKPNAQFHPGKAGELWLGELAIGQAGELEQAATEKLGLMHATVYGEFDVDEILAAATKTVPKFSDLPKFPQSTRDLAFILPRRTQAADVIATLRQAAGNLTEHIHVFDVYEGTGIPPGHKSIAFRLQFRHPDRTLAQAEIDAAIERATAAVSSAHAGQLRS
jgi:phenylalanyl-tRNA synthetase beta chain